MKASVLFSGGKDSSLSAILLEPFFEIELITFSFSLLPVGEFVSKSAYELGCPYKILYLDTELLDKALEMAIEDGYPKNAINYIHYNAIKRLAYIKSNSKEVIADGTRRNDRVPMLVDSQIQSLEDKYNIHYITPLKGYGRSAVDVLVQKYLEIEQNQSEKIIKADYETELREIIRQTYGDDKVSQIFPSHVQSRIIKRIK
jgi:hypothetical protein